MSFNPLNYSKNDRVIDVKAFFIPQQVTRLLLTVVAVLTCLSILVHGVFYFLPDFPGQDFLVSKFALNEEHNIPTLYSSLALFYCSALFWLIALLKAHPTRNEVRYWKGLSVVFLYLSVDEMVALHESFSKLFHKLGVNGILHNAWVVPGIIAIAIFLITFYKFFLTLPNFLKRSILMAIFLWVGGALFVETLGGYYKYLYGEENLGYALLTTVEEVMEMLGVVVLIHGLLLYLNKIVLHQIDLSLNLTQSHLTPPNLNAQLEQKL